MDLVENIADIVSDTNINVADIEDMEICEDQPLEETLVRSIDEQKLEDLTMDAEEFDDEFQCPNLPNGYFSSASMELEIRRSLARKYKIYFDEQPSTVAYKKRYMSMDEALDSAKHQKGIVPIQKIGNSLSLLTYILSTFQKKNSINLQLRSTPLSELLKTHLIQD